MAVVNFCPFPLMPLAWKFTLAFYRAGNLQIVDEKTKQNPEAFCRWVDQQDVKVMVLPPAYLTVLDMRGLRNLRVLITGGESPSREQISVFVKTNTYFNAYWSYRSINLCFGF